MTLKSKSCSTLSPSMAMSAGVIVLPSEVLKLPIEALPMDEARPPPVFDFRSMDEGRPVISGTLGAERFGPDAKERIIEVGMIDFLGIC